jgi:hypothetical protein
MSQIGMVGPPPQLTAISKTAKSVTTEASNVQMGDRLGCIDTSVVSLSGPLGAT